jgi:hypothetical protein
VPKFDRVGHGRDTEMLEKNGGSIMRRLLLLVSVLLLGVSWVAAQDSTSTGQTSSGQNNASQTSASQSDSNAAGAQTIEGCLSGSNGKYTLTDSQGKSYDLSGGDSAKLANHVGHEVKITGTVGAGSASSSDSQMGSSGQTLQITSMKHVAKTCKNAGGGMSH